ncbi:hypothetical protein E2C01_044334 [Portunus trituberculatus]|uniref:Uncharacterized protein n=1 Tax=Portunus trituberculatus TaxID=210409 RepID=A0A5B7FYY0_PORTR|nr:hypothetical protein [Portunus trituberculatus]
MYLTQRIPTFCRQLFSYTANLASTRRLCGLLCSCMTMTS